MIHIQNLEHSYQKEKKVIKIKNFSIQNSERVFLEGPSGSGKSTLLSLICGILSVQQGDITFDEFQLAKMSQRQKDSMRGNHIGYIFQLFNLIPYLNVTENILLPVQINPVRRKNEPQYQKRCDEILNLLGIYEHKNSPIHTLSVGQQQRVAAARAFIGKPRLIVADEPTSALDSSYKDVFIDLLNQLWSEYKPMILFVSHDRSLSKHFDRTVSLPNVNEVHHAHV